jgi:Gpi18-like mannosyltransferase
MRGIEGNMERADRWATSLGVRRCASILSWANPTRSEHARLALVLLVAALTRLFLAPRGELLWDLDMYIAWGSALLKHPGEVYALSQSNYPPLTLYLFGGVVALYTFLAHLLHQPATLDLHIPLLSLLAKLPTLLADLGTIAVLWGLLRREVGERWALGVAAAYALSPAVLLDGVVWGQSDGIPIFFLLLCLAALFAGRYGWAGVCFAVAVMLKPQPIVFAPLLLVWLYRSGGWRPILRASATAATTALAICAPFLAPPHPQLAVFYQNTIASFQGSAPIASANTMSLPGPTTWNAYNLWWLLGPNRAYQSPLLGPLSATTVGTLLFLAALGLAVAGIWRDQSRGRLYAALSLVAVAFFAVTTLQHERYLFPALALLLLAAAHDRRYLIPCIVAQVVVFLNVGFVAIWYLAMHAYQRAALPWYLLGHDHPALIAAIAWGVLGLCLGLIALYGSDLVGAMPTPCALLPRQLRRLPCFRPILLVRGGCNSTGSLQACTHPLGA